MSKHSKKIEFNIYIVLYMSICLGWSYIYKKGLPIERDPFINLLFIAVFALIANNLYILLSRRASDTDFWYRYWQIPLILSISSLVLADTFSFIFYILLLSSFISLITTIVKKDKSFIIPTLITLVASLLYFYKLKLLMILSVLVATFYLTYKKYGYKKVEYLNFLPVAQKSVSKTVALLCIFLISMSYVLDLDTLAINISVNSLMVISLIFISANLESIGRGYEEMKSFYVLAQYIEKERDEFSGLIHDEIIQDIKAGRNLLGLKEPDTKRSMEILKNLENKCRQLMNFYSSNLFDYFSFEENFENMLLSLERLYPNKNIHIDWTVEDEISKILNKNIKQNIMQISKELINNIYRHSTANFIIYSCRIADGIIEIDCESDGASKEDYERIKNSKGGVLILKVLVNNNRGEINYNYKDGLLKTDIKLKPVRENENTII